ncbi:fimbrial protein [Pantoea sp. Mb-10]|uniref:fimbrial protein n=1 Tax=unclassified Pantoea TaxID=2630326 RepID=UPI001E5C8B6D|nr:MULTISPECIES: fimbrial protein [unclassified Pantoea]MCE0491282.1 fimbrial protein [Pantoea sp. Mb-10]MCE0502771.1 fimbrial protein [Pantoea sp. Pb-8]
MKKTILAFVSFALIAFSANGWAFTCTDITGNVLSIAQGSTSANAYVNLQPSLGANQNLVVNLANSISCRNDFPNSRNDLVSMVVGSTYGGALSNFTGSLSYFNSSYNFPLTSATKSVNYRSGAYQPWNTVLYLTPVSTAAGVVIRRGEKFATIVMYQVGSDIVGGGNISTARFTWNLYANNDVIIPTGGCDVSSRNVSISLPDFPGSKPVPLTVRCAKAQNLGFYLSGSTEDQNRTIFSNTASGNKAKGVGIQLLRNGSAVPANTNILLGSVGTSPVSLGLTATYGQTTGQVTAGNVQSVIGVTFIYP